MADNYDRNRGGYQSRDRGRGSSIFDDDRARSQHDQSDDDRGFFQRARDEVSSWFSDDDDWGSPNSSYRDDDRRSRDEGRYERGQGRFEGREGRSGGSGFGGGSGGYGSVGSSAGHDYGMRTRGFEQDRNRDRFGGSDRHPQTVANEPTSRSYGGGRERQQGLGEGEYFARGQASRGAGSGNSERSRSEARYGAHGGFDQQGSGGNFGRQDRGFEQAGSQRFGGRAQFGDDRGDNQRFRGQQGGGRQHYGGQDQNRSQQSQGGGQSGWHPDDHYRSWRDRQLQALDRDYEDYCREREQQFHQDFSSWRQSRQSRLDQERSQGSTGGGDPQSQDVLSLGTSQAIGDAQQTNSGNASNQPTVASGQSDATGGQTGKQGAGSSRSSRTSS